MKILAIEHETPGIAAERFKPLLTAEAARVWALYQAGVLREMYFRTDQSSAVLILECADVAEAGELLNTLPLVAEGLIRFEIIALAPYPGFARLFDESIS